MIEFRGRLSGTAEKHFHKKSQKLGRNLLLVSMLIILPFIIRLSISFNSWLILGVYAVLMIMLPLLVYIPQTVKERSAILPKRIYTEEDSIICIADKYAESRYIEDAKELIDFGDYYEIVFPFGKISDKFVCQKDLLAVGTLEEFESLFEGRITRRN